MKSDQYEIADSAQTPKAVKFEDGLSKVVGREDGEENLETAIPWFEEFPKRWIIVILCFSAFLLCNMDRVSFFSSSSSSSSFSNLLIIIL